MGFLSHKSIYAGLECLDALGANILAVEGHDVLRAVTEDTGRLIFLHDDIGAIDVNLETVTLCDVKSAAKLDGEDNAPQFVDFAHDTGRFHKFHPFPVRAGVPGSGSCDTNPCNKTYFTTKRKSVNMQMFTFC